MHSSIEDHVVNAGAVEVKAEPAVDGKDPLGDDLPKDPLGEDLPNDMTKEPEVSSVHAAVGALYLGEEVTIAGQVRMSLARGGRNVHFRVRGPLNDALRALGPLRVMPGPYENGEIILRIVGPGQGRVVETRDRANYCSVEYRADPAVIELLRERHTHRRPLVAEASITIRIPPADEPTPTPTAAPTSEEEWTTDGEGGFCLVRSDPALRDGLLERASDGLDGTWRYARAEDALALARAKASGDYIERNF